MGDVEGLFASPSPRHFTTDEFNRALALLNSPSAVSCLGHHLLLHLFDERERIDSRLDHKSLARPRDSVMDIPNFILLEFLHNH